tara:strand:- start:214 stop:684 length:471 start_codon:yes stop_codon:yes gene_type:complete
MPPKRKEMPWYTQSLLSLLGKGKSVSGGYYTHNPESINIMYNMFADELGFNPSMVKRFNILTKVLPKELSSYIRTGDVTQSMQNIRKPLLDIYTNTGSTSQPELLKAILQYDEENNLYTDEGRKFVQRATNSGLLNEQNIRNLYFSKYQEKYPYRN